MDAINAVLEIVDLALVVTAIIAFFVAVMKIADGLDTIQIINLKLDELRREIRDILNRRQP